MGSAWDAALRDFREQFLEVAEWGAALVGGAGQGHGGEKTSSLALSKSRPGRPGGWRGPARMMVVTGGGAGAEDRDRGTRGFIHRS